MANVNFTYDPGKWYNRGQLEMTSQGGTTQRIRVYKDSWLVKLLSNFFDLVRVQAKGGQALYLGKSQLEEIRKFSIVDPFDNNAPATARLTTICKLVPGLLQVAIKNAPLLLQKFSDDDFTKLREAAASRYQDSSAEKDTINSKLVQEFRRDEKPSIPRCHRAYGTNLDTLVKLKGTDLCYPANKVQIGNNTYIQAEAPTNDKANSRAHYYQMAVESGAQVLVTVNSGYRAGRVDPTIMDFLSPGESITFQSDGDSYEVTCAKEELKIPLPKEIQAKTDLTGECSYHVRRLTVKKNGAPTGTIQQIVPDFTSVAVPFALSQYTVDLVNTFVAGDRNHPVIVNCQTGKDRSGQFIVLDSMARDIEDLEKTMPRETLLPKIDVVAQLRARALMLEEQSTVGSGVESIEQTLLPCFDREIPAQDRKVYSSLSVDEKKVLHTSINDAYTTHRTQVQPEQVVAQKWGYRLTMEGGKTLDMPVSKNISCSALKDQIAEKLKLPKERFRLLCAGKEVGNESPGSEKFVRECVADIAIVIPKAATKATQAPANAGTETIQLHIKTLTGHTKNKGYLQNITYTELKEQVAQDLGVASQQIRLIYNGAVIGNEEPGKQKYVKELQSGATIYVVFNPNAPIPLPDTIRPLFEPLFQAAEKIPTCTAQELTALLQKLDFKKAEQAVKELPEGFHKSAVEVKLEELEHKVANALVDRLSKGQEEGVSQALDTLLGQQSQTTFMTRYGSRLLLAAGWAQATLKPGVTDVATHVFPVSKTGENDFEAIKFNLEQMKKIISFCEQGSAYKGFRDMTSAIEKLEQSVATLKSQGRADIQTMRNMADAINSTIRITMHFCAYALKRNQDSTREITLPLLADGTKMEKLRFTFWYRDLIGPTFIEKMIHRAERLAEQVDNLPKAWQNEVEGFKRRAEELKALVKTMPQASATSLDEGNY